MKPHPCLSRNRVYQGTLQIGFDSKYALYNINSYIFSYFLIIEGAQAFCPAHCTETQQTCAGQVDPATGNQIGPDTCIPQKAGNCMMHCPVYCPAGMVVCPGPMVDGCPGAPACLATCPAP